MASSNRHSALSHILLTNQQSDKMAALRSDLVEWGLVPSLHAPPPDPFNTEKHDKGAVDDASIPTKVNLARKQPQTTRDTLTSWKKRSNNQNLLG
ncbi:hypothetical protein PM082_024219 [Marasmius tenuissimus]|nr:hypothetical protein PM082_024219 [Marasmius tenuissimus]